MTDATGADMLVLKSHVKGHVRGGHYVGPYERKDGPGAAPKHPNAAPHPRRDHKGDLVTVNEPSRPSAPSTWEHPDAVATFVPHGHAPEQLHGVPLEPWHDAPTTDDGWDYVDGVNDDLAEPPFVVTPGKVVGAGVIIEEPDGRVWVCAPTNGFGGYRATFPKGTAEHGLSLQANACKEAFEETGLKVRITGFIGDFERTTSKARMYRAVRVGGTPTAMGWESQAVHLIPKDRLYDHLNGWADHPVAEAIGAGPAPEPPPKPKQPPIWGQKKWGGPSGGTGSLF